MIVESIERSEWKRMQMLHDNEGTGKGNAQLEKFFSESLKCMYWAEKNFVKALPKMQEAATTEELKTATGEHLTQTQGHVTRLELVFEMLGEKAGGKKCKVMQSLINSGSTIIQETQDGSMTRDAAIVMAAQKVEHYEIAAYGGMLQLAKVLNENEVAEILYQILEEEKQADESLAIIAENSIDWEAEQEVAIDKSNSL